MVNLNEYSLRLVKEKGGRYDFDHKKITSPETASILIAHNHPSGDLTPSKPDIAIAER